MELHMTAEQGEALKACLMGVATQEQQGLLLGVLTALVLAERRDDGVLVVWAG